MSAIAIDCEMVGTGPFAHSEVARVSLVNENGSCALDSFIKPRNTVTDYRTFISGITESDLRNAPPLHEVKRKVEMVISGRILVGHSVDKDVAALELSIPQSRLRDIAKYKAYQYANGQPKSLKDLSKTHLNRNIQDGQHSSVEDAKAAMDLYKLAVRNGWNC